jgi:tetratricopeptide (TPR) repeat protein
MMKVKAINVTDIEPRRIMGGTMLWHPVRRTLGIRSFGTNAYTALNPGDRVVEEHSEGAARHEEVYIVLRGCAEFQLGDDTAEVGAGELVFISDPDLRRGAVATEANTTVIAFGGPVGTPYEPLVWEHDFAAQECYDAGDFEAAYEIASEGLEEHGKSARLHYNLACYAARGRHQELALHHLEQATKLDADLVRTWSADDHDLDSVRERAGL